MSNNIVTKVRLTLFVSPEVKKQAKMLAIVSGATVSELFESLINADQIETTRVKRFDNK